MTGTEKSIKLGIIPARNTVYADAIHMVVALLADERIAGAGRNDFQEGLHIKFYIITIVVEKFNAFPIHIFRADFVHKGSRRIDIGLGHRLNGKNEVFAGQNRHRSIVSPFAAGAGQDFKRNGNGFSLLPRQRLIGHHPRHIAYLRIGGDDNIGIIGA